MVITIDLNYRHEWKHELNLAQMLAIRSRISQVANTDAHAVDGKYLIRSLYFDNMQDKALREKIDGVNMREKFRIRYYNNDTSFIHLEKKSRLNGLGTKFSALLNESQVKSILDGDIGWMIDSKEPLIRELYCKIKYQGMKPRTIVDYTREPFIFTAGNVRVTFDYNIRTSTDCRDFLSAECVTIPAGDPVIILEVKWDAFLPAIIKDAVAEQGVRVGAFSKYARCRIYG